VRRFIAFAAACCLLAAPGCAATMTSPAEAPAGTAATGTAQVRAPADAKAFYEAVDKGRIDEVRAGLDAHPEWVHSREHRWGVPPLHVASWSGHTEVAALLIARGADVNTFNERWRWRPIHEAAVSGHLDIVKLLLDHGADLDVENRDGLTPLAMAAGGGHRDIVELLIRRGASVATKGRGGWTPLHMAAGHGDTALATLIIAKGADVQAKTDAGRTPLHWAASADVARLLLDRGADARAAGNGGRTPLHLAAFFGFPDVAELLIAKGADVGAADRRGRTPLDLAVEERHAEVAKLLEDHGAKRGTPPGETAADVTETRVGPKGQFYVGGKPTIPFGVWQQPRRLFEYNRALGLDCLVCPPGGGLTDRSSTTGYVRAAHECGLGAFVHWHEELAELPGTWGWLGGGWPIGEARRRYEQIRRSDDRHVIVCNFGAHDFIKGAETEYYTEALRYVDCIVPHVWPEMFEGEPRNLRNVALMVDGARALCKDRPRGEVSIWADISVHEWRHQGWPELCPAPTPEELRFQIWLALIHGADGVCLFTISFDPFVFSQIPARIEEFLPGCIRRVQSYAAVLADDESPLGIKVTGDRKDGIVDFTTRRHDGNDYVFLVNGTAAPQTVTLRLKGLARSWQLRDAVADKPLDVSGDTYAEKLDGLALRIWKLEPVR